MSFYGNTQRIIGNNFQFDRIYPSRKEMDALCTTDGVYAGRYVLVEYGQRFEKTPTSGAVNPETSIWNGEQIVYKDAAGNVIAIDNADYNARAKEDLEKYGAMFDSTVWQKVYYQGQDLYIMVAELNAKAPKMELNSVNPIYLNNKGTNSSILIKSTNNKIYELTNAQEIYRTPNFNHLIDTELTYQLNYPKPVQLTADNDTIEYNANGFNIAYSYPQKDGASGIALVPTINHNKIRTIDGAYNARGFQQATLNTSSIDISKKELYFSIPAIGNTMDSIYDLLYGSPDPELEPELFGNTNDDEHYLNSQIGEGLLRPYFRKFIRTINFQNNVRALNSQNKLVDVEIQIGDGAKEKLQVSGPIQTPDGAPNVVSVKFTSNEIPENATITPDTLERTIDSNGNICLKYKNNNQLLTHTMHLPTGEEDRNATWLSQVPEFKDIIKNNKAGLAIILSSLFGVTNPLTGQVAYYLYNDWTADTFDDSNIPAILNKPYVIGGYPMTFLANTKDDAIQDQGDSGYTYTVISTDLDHPSKGHYEIDFDNWQLFLTP